MTSFLETIRKVRTSQNLDLKDCPLISSGFRPYPYQVPMVVNMLLAKVMVNGEDTGLGKTIETACFYALRRSKDPTLNCLVVSPKNALFQWRDEFKVVAPQIPLLVVRTQRPRGSSFARDPEWRAYQYQQFQTGVMVVNYHQLFKEWETITTRLGKFVVVYDEATKFKEMKTKLHEVIKQVSAKAVGCYALTATVVKGHLYEAFGICDGLNIAPWGSTFRFEGLYPVFEFRPVRIWGRERNIRTVVGWKNLEQFRSEFEPYFFSRTVEEVAAQLPEVITKNLLLEMPPANWEKYQEAEDGLLMMPDQSIRESRTLAKLHYCQCISNSPLEMGFQDLVDSKVEALQELLDNELEGEKVLIYSRYKRMVDYLEKYFRERDVVTLKVTGDVSDEGRYEAKEKFKQPEYRIFLLNDAGSESMNLQVARGVVCLDFPWSWGNYKQLIGRARRQGGTQINILVFHLMHQSTIDEDVYALLEEEKALVVGAIGKANTILTQTTSDFAERLLQRILARRARKEEARDVN